jgi:hypothetical protein
MIHEFCLKNTLKNNSTKVKKYTTTRTSSSSMSEKKIEPILQWKKLKKQQFEVFSKK